MNSKLTNSRRRSHRSQNTLCYSLNSARHRFSDHPKPCASPVRACTLEEFEGNELCSTTANVLSYAALPIGSDAGNH